MPVDYGAYQIDPMAGVNQGLVNIGQALHYRQQMERQKRQDAQGAETARLSQTLSQMGIEEAEATRGALSNLYSKPGEPPLDLAGTIQAQMAEKKAIEKETQRNARIKFLLDIHESLGGSDENKTEVMKGIIGKDPDPDIQAMANNLKIKGKKISFTREITEADIVKLKITNPDLSRALPGIYDVEGEATGDDAKPFRTTGSKMRIPQAPQDRYEPMGHGQMWDKVDKKIVKVPVTPKEPKIEKPEYTAKQAMSRISTIDSTIARLKTTGTVDTGMAIQNPMLAGLVDTKDPAAVNQAIASLEAERAEIIQYAPKGYGAKPKTAGITMGQLWGEVTKTGSASAAVEYLKKTYNYNDQQARDIIQKGINAGKIK